MSNRPQKEHRALRHSMMSFSRNTRAKLQYKRDGGILALQRISPI